MSALKKLQELTQGLLPTELENCKSFLKAFDSRGEKYESKSLKLLNIISNPKNNDLREAEIVFQIYGTRRSIATFSRLLIRLREKICDALALQMNVEREGVFSEKVLTRINLRRRINHADILFHRKQPELADIVIEGLIERAEEFELLDEQLAVYRLQSQIAIHYNGDKKINRLNHKITDCRRRISVIETAKELFYLSRFDKAEKIPERIEELKQYYRESPSVTAEVFLLRAEIEVISKSNRLVEEYKLLKKVLNYSLKHKAVKSSGLQIDMYLKLCQNNMLRLRFPEAIININEAEGIYLAEKQSPGWDFLYLRFHAFYYSGKLNPLGQFVKEQVPQQFEPIWNYYRAVYHFIAGDYEETFSLTGLHSGTEFYKAGLGNWPKLMQMMSLLTLWSRLEMNMRNRVIERIERQLIISEMNWREKMAYEFLQKIVSQKMNFKHVHIAMQNEFHIFQNPEPENRWMFFSPELIPFEKWFFAMLTKSDFKTVITFHP